MRDSLVHALQLVLRDTSVRPEQNTDETKPVDIRVEWFASGASALIEIKWLGRSTAKAAKVAKPVKAAKAAKAKAPPKAKKITYTNYTAGTVIAPQAGLQTNLIYVGLIIAGLRERSIDDDYIARVKEIAAANNPAIANALRAL